MDKERKTMAIELYKDGEFVHWFPSQKEAADWIGVPQSRLSDSIRRGIKTKGYEVRVGKSVADTIAGFSQQYQIKKT